MEKRDLPKGALQPRAQPLSTFIGQSAITPAAPARPSEVQAPAGFTMIQTGSKPNIGLPDPGAVGRAAAGNAAQLAESLGAFNRQLLETTGSVLSWYAKDQNERGFNEVMKAATMVDRQQRQSALEYGEENRALAARDPLAAMAMDQVNPFRMGGRKRALAQLAGQEIPNAITLALSDPKLALLGTSDPKLIEAKSAATMEVLQRYGIQEGSPGFIDFVLPQLNRAWERGVAQHQQTRVKILDQTFAKTTAVGLIHRAKDARINQGWAADQTVPALQQWLDSEFGQLGLPEKVAQYQEEAILRAWQIARDEQDYKTMAVLGPLLTGLPGDPNRLPAVLAYGLEMGEINEKLASREYTQLNRARQQQLRDAKDAFLELTGNQGMSPQQAAEMVVNGQVPGLDLSAVSPSDLIVGLSGFVEAESTLQEKLYDETQFQDFLEQNRDAAVEGTWTPQRREEFIQESDRIIEQAPQGLRQQLRDQRRRVLEGNDQAQARGIGGEASRIISERINQNITREYPEFMVGNDAYNSRAWQTRAQDTAESRIRQRQAFTKHVNAYLAQKQAEAGGRPLTQPEIIQFTSEALDQYGRNNPEALQYLFPGGATSGQPTSVEGGKTSSGRTGGRGVSPGATSSTSGSAKPAERPTLYSASTLQNAPNIEDWDSTPLLEPDSVMDMVPRILENGRYPRAFINAAKRAGTSPGRLLLRQLEFMREPDGSPMFQLTPEQRRKVLTSGQRRAAADAYAETTVAMAVSPLLGVGGDSGGPVELTVVRAQEGAAPAQAPQQPAYTRTEWAREWLARLLLPSPVIDPSNPVDWRVRQPGAIGPGGDGYYQIGSIGPTSTGPHADIAKLDANGNKVRYDFRELDQFVTVDGQPLSQSTVHTSGLDAWRDNGTRRHMAHDLAPRGAGKMRLVNGARWVSHRMTKHGERSEFVTPDGTRYRVIHGTFKKAPARSGRMARMNPGPFTGANPTTMQNGVQALLRAGFPRNGAAFLAGNIQQESSWKGQRTWADPGGGAKAGGLVSWNDTHGRLSKIEKMLGKPIEQATHAEQLAVMVKELRQDYPEAYRIFMNPNSSDDDLMRASRLYWGYGHEGKRFTYAREIMGSYVRTY